MESVPHAHKSFQAALSVNLLQSAFSAVRSILCKEDIAQNVKCLCLTVSHVHSALLFLAINAQRLFIFPTIPACLAPTSTLSACPALPINAKYAYQPIFQTFKDNVFSALS